MRRTILIICLLAAFSLLSAEYLGNVKFILGQVEYKESQNATYKKANLNMPLDSEGWLKTGLAAKVEISFTDGSQAVLEQNSTRKISDLYEAASAGKGAKMKRRLQSISHTKNRELTGVAGIRRSEAHLERKSDYYWEFEDLAELSTALELYEEDKLDEAIEILEKVIEQAPLSREAELAHATLILIYEELGNKAQYDEHVRLLRQDFEHSIFLEDLPE